MIKIYFAGPLFTLAEKEFNIRLSNKITEYISCEIILPQERALNFLDLDNKFHLIFEDCLSMVSQANIIIGILDGSDADSGTSVELGYAYAKNIPIIGVRTDFRASEENGLNLMLSNLCTTLVHDTTGDLNDIAIGISQAISSIKSNVLKISD